MATPTGRTDALLRSQDTRRCPDSLDEQKAGKKVQTKEEVEQLFSLKTIHNNFPFMAVVEGYCQMTERGAHMHCATRSAGGTVTSE
jgi:hypothetical protein